MPNIFPHSESCIAFHCVWGIIQSPQRPWSPLTHTVHMFMPLSPCSPRPGHPNSSPSPPIPPNLPPALLLSNLPHLDPNPAVAEVASDVTLVLPWPTLLAPPTPLVGQRNWSGAVGTPPSLPVGGRQTKNAHPLPFRVPSLRCLPGAPASLTARGPQGWPA